MPPPVEGDVLAGKYRIEKVLGQGGMGVVVQAMHIQLDERVAVKFLLDDYSQHPEASARFLREARAAVKIKSEHVARVIDVGTLDSGAPYMVMEFLQGQDLSEALEKQGPLPVEDAIEFVLQACEAIAEAHAAGIVHRDLKPANLFSTRRADGSQIVKVLDFGISKVTRPGESGADMSLTKTSTMMGSPLYMSPEQMRSSRDVDARSDIWSLGAILYELISGRTPFLGESLPELCAHILTEDPPPLSSVRAGVSANLSAAIQKCLVKNPAQRYQSVAELAAGLSPFGPKRSLASAERISRVLGATSGFAATAAGNGGRPDTPARTGTQTDGAWGNSASPHDARGSKRWLLIGSAALLLVLGGVGALALKSDPAPAPTAENAPASPPPPVAQPAPPPAIPATAPTVAGASSPPGKADESPAAPEAAHAEPALPPEPSPAPATTATAAATKLPPVRKATAVARKAPATTQAPPAAERRAPSTSGGDSRTLLFGDRK